MISFKDISSRKNLSLREQFYRGTVLKIGQMVEDDCGKYQILDRGTNYLTCSDSRGDIVKKFISEVVSLPQRPLPDSVSNFKGLVTVIEDPIALVCFESTIDKYARGDIVDAIAVIKALRAYSENDTEQLKASLTRINELESHIYLKENMSSNIKNSDRVKVASVIADTLGSSSSGSSPEIMVNTALRNAKKNSMMIKGESLKIIMRMLELASSVGIKYDESIIKVPVEESLDESASRFIQKVTQAENSAASGKHKTAIMHLDSARSFMGSIKSTDTEKISAAHDSYKNLRKKYSGQGGEYKINHNQVGSAKVVESESLDESLEESSLSGYSKMADFKDGSLSHQYYHKEIPVGKPADRHLSIISVNTIKGSPSKFTAIHQKESGYHTYQGKGSYPAVVVSHRSVHSTMLDSVGALDDHVKKHYSLKEESQLEELSTDMLSKYKKAAGASASAHDDAANRDHVMYDYKSAKTNRERANKRFSGIVKATKKQFSNDLKEGASVAIDHSSGKKLFGKVKGHHGSVVEVQYKNGKIAFQHSHKVHEISEVEAQAPQQFMTYNDIIVARSGDA
jgi:hypothetical protein